MIINHSRTGRSYTYRHLSDEQVLRLEDIRHTAKEIDKGYYGYFPLTRNEYFLLLPMLNPIVIAWNTRAYRQMCRSVNVSKDTKRVMKQNLLLSSLVGFLPIANIAFSRKFKCTTRNLQAVEAQMQDDEFEYEEQQRAIEAAEKAGQDVDSIANDGKQKRRGLRSKKARLQARERYEDVPLPPSTKRMFNRCPRFIRNTEYPHIAYTPVDDQIKSNRNSVATVYYSPRTSLNLEGFEDLESLWSTMLSEGPCSLRDSASSRSSGSDITLTDHHSGTKRRHGLFSARNMAAIRALSSSKKASGDSANPSASFASVMKELVTKRSANLSSADGQQPAPATSFASVMKELVSKRNPTQHLAEDGQKPAPAASFASVMKELVSKRNPTQPLEDDIITPTITTQTPISVQ